MFTETNLNLAKFVKSCVTSRLSKARVDETDGGLYNSVSAIKQKYRSNSNSVSQQRMECPKGKKKVNHLSFKRTSRRQRTSKGTWPVHNVPGGGSGTSELG